MSNPRAASLKAVVRGAYDIQKLRIQMGNRLVGNFKARLGQLAGMKEDTLDGESKQLLAEIRALAGADNLADIVAKVKPVPVSEETSEEEDEAVEAEGGATAEAKKQGKLAKLIVRLVTLNYKFMTDNRKSFPTYAKFSGNPVISDYTELTLAAEYMELLKSEEQHFSRLENVLQGFSIWNEWLGKVKGVGPAMGGVIISEIDIHKARHASCIWKYAGLDVANDGRGRGRYKEHLVKREYTTKDGKTELRDSVTFHPFLKTKLCGVLAGSFLRSKAPYSEIYRNEKHRLENHVKYGTANDKVLDEKGHKVTGKLKRHRMAIRKMVKLFLVDLYVAWRGLEGLPVSKPYSEAKLGMPPHGQGPVAGQPGVES